MLTLYVKTNCPYSAVALHAVEDLGLTVETKNVADEGVVEEMIALGGKKQEPFLVDHDRDVKMYEHDDIVEYLKEHYGSDATNVNMRLHRIDDSNVCEACE